MYTLPEKYTGINRELINGSCYWNSTECHDVIYTNNKFVVDGKLLEVGTKGFIAVGANPGSYPQPIIIADVKHDEGIVGLIYPFVYVYEQFKYNVPGTDYIELKIGAYMCTKQAQPFECIHYNNVEHPDIFTQDVEYIINYVKHKYIMNTAYFLSVGSFGNISLPTMDGFVPYEHVVS